MDSPEKQKRWGTSHEVVFWTDGALRLGSSVYFVSKIPEILNMNVALEVKGALIAVQLGFITFVTAGFINHYKMRKDVRP